MGSNVFFENITKYFYQIAEQAGHANSLGLSNTAIHAENLYAEILEIVFSWKLYNANEENRNQDTYDLIDEKKSRLVQVTTNKKYKAKYDKTLKGATKSGKSVKNVVIVFLCKKLPASIPARSKLGRLNIETYDIPRLLDAIFFRVKSPKKLRTLNELLQISASPVLIDIHAAQRFLPVPQQTLVARRPGIYIKRPQLLESLFKFAQQESGLLVGGPGYGKSFILEELQEKYYALGLGCVLIRINELTIGNDQEIGQELRTNDNWLAALRTLPINNDHKALIIFDAYDTAKDETLKTNILKQIRRCLTELKDKCRVLVSVRTYDATRSRKLQELFPHQYITETVRCRNLEIGELTLNELETAIWQLPFLHQIFSSCSPALQKLLHTPYFLKLFEQIVIDKGLQNGKIFSGIETEGQLLGIYWRLTVEDDAAKELLIRQMTLTLAEKETLVCGLSEIIVPATLSISEHLISNGVISTSGSTGNKIGFTHNILLDFAISKYMLDDDPAELATFLRSHEKLPFIFRQSFLYYYSSLYLKSNAVFWTHYRYFGKIEEPLFRLLHQTSLNYVLVSFYKNIEELMPVFEGIKDDAYGNRIRKLLEAVRFITKGQIRHKDLQLLSFATQNMHWLYLWETGNLLDLAIKINLENDGLHNGRLISGACFDYLDFVLSERTVFEHKYLIDRNGGRFGVRNFCRTIAFNKKRGRTLIKKLIELLQEEDFPIDFFHDLADLIMNVFQVDRTAAKQAFLAMYLHQETSDKQTSMGSSVVMSFLSNRKQDYGLVPFRLEKIYPEMLRFDFIEAMKIGFAIINHRSGYRLLAWPSGKTSYKVKVNNINSGLDENRDMFEHFGTRGPDGIIENVFKVLEDNSKLKGQEKEFEQQLVAIVEAARSSNIWRRILYLLIEDPKPQIEIVFGILINQPFYISDETRHEIGVLLRSAWVYLNVEQQKTIEQIILDLQNVQVLKDRGIQDLRVGMMLGCIPESAWTLDESHNFMASHEPQDNYKVIQGPIAAKFYHQTREEKMQRAGFNPKVKVEAKRYDQITTIEEFNARFQNNKEEISEELFRPLMPAVMKLKEQASSWKGDMRRNAEYEVAQFLSNISHLAGLTSEEETFIGQTCIAFILDPRYDTEHYEIGEMKRMNSSYSPNARTASIFACSNMIVSTKGAPEYLDAIEGLLTDNSYTVRHLASRVVRYFWHYDNDRFWRVTTARIQQETDGMPFGEYLTNLCYDNIIRQNVDQAKTNILVALLRMVEVDNENGRELWSLIAVNLVAFILKHDAIFARDTIRQHLANEALVHQLIFQITNAIDPHSVENSYEKGDKIYDALFEVLLEVVDYQFDSIQKIGITDPEVSVHFGVIDYLLDHMNIITTSGKASVRNEILPKNVRGGFYRKIEPLLDQIVNRSTAIASGFMVARTGYNFMQILNFMVDENPEHILLLANKIVQYAAKNGFTYDSSTLSEIVQLTECFIADHKEVLYKTQNFNQLIVILDLFANSGWQDALELTWQLKDAF